MSRMIPSILSDDEKRKSIAESDIFEWLRKMEWGDAIVMHSLSVKDHMTKSFGEIDYIIICEMGVLCVEVKGGLVEFKNGLWWFTPLRSNREPDKKTEGPYKQAQGNMKSIKQYLEKVLSKDDKILKCRWACCVMTPDCIVGTDNITEIIPEITFDINMRQEELPEYYERCFKYWSEKKHFGGTENLNKKDRERLATLIRGDFSLIPPLSAVINKTDDMLLSITGEQLEIISNMFENERMLVKGGAGTGKTLLATEQCRRFSVVGEKVLYLCFNDLISEYVKCVFNNDPSASNVDVYTFHELLIHVCKCNDVPEINKDAFFNDALPAMFIEKLGKTDKECFTYDRVIIDEGQDLLKESAFLCIDELIKGGWKNGRWTLYYDENQNIFVDQTEFNEVLATIKKYAFTYPLTVNCRNTKQICTCNRAITLLPQPKFLKAEGEEVKYIPYSDINNEAMLLFDSLRRIKSEGVLRKDIVILSPYSLNNPKSCLYKRIIPNDIGKIRTNVKRFQDNKDIRFYTVQAFKGLESKIVILIDIDNFDNKERVLQNYIGISRARSYLEVFFDASLKQQRQERLLQSLINQGGKT